jgi:hypothetical protein
MTKVKFLRTACPFLVALLLGLGGLPMASAQAPLNLRIINNSNFQNSQVYLMFGGIAAGFDATATVNGTPNTALVLGTSYALSQISDIKLTSFRGGRVFISLGSALMSASAGTAWNPNFNNPSLPDYNTRWDKVEITYATGLPSGGANLSAQDFFSIPLQINTYTAANPDTPVTTLTWRAPTATVFSSVGALSGGNSTAVLTGSNGVQTQNYGQVLPWSVQRRFRIPLFTLRSILTLAFCDLGVSTHRSRAHSIQVNPLTSRLWSTQEGIWL